MAWQRKQKKSWQLYERAEMRKTEKKQKGMREPKKWSEDHVHAAVQNAVTMTTMEDEHRGKKREANGDNSKHCCSLKRNRRR